MTGVLSLSFKQLELIEEFREKNYSNFNKIRKFLEKNIDNFPYAKAHETAYFLHKTLGFEEVGGSLIEFDKNELTHNHFWNRDRKSGLYICLTMDQFNNNEINYSAITILEPNSQNILHQRDRHTKFQQEKRWNSKNRLENIEKLISTYSS